MQRKNQVQIQNRLTKSTQHRLQRTPKEIGQAAAVPLLCGRGLSEKAQAFRRISPVPPLPLSQSVRRFVRKIFNEHKRETNSSI
jgi:hypothetical protein